MAEPARPKIQIRTLMELILLLAAGTAFARGQYKLMVESGLWGMSKPSDVIRVVGGAASSGMAVAGGLLLLIDSRTHPGRSQWGLGRWIWSTTAIATLLYFLVRFGQSVFSDFQMEHRQPSTFELRNRASSFFSIALTGDFPFALAAFCCTAFFAKSLIDHKPDVREWSGLVFGSFVIALSLAVRGLQIVGR